MISENTLYNLGITARQALHTVDGIQYWLDDGDIASFSLIKRTFDNGLFEINNQNYWRLWWSQISMPMYNGNPDGFFSVSWISFRDGRQKAIPLIELDDFVNQVRGRRFKVTVHSDICLVPNRNNIKVQQLYTCGKIYEHVHTRLMSGKFEEVKGMLKIQRRYTFTEI